MSALQPLRRVMERGGRDVLAVLVAMATASQTDASIARIGRCPSAAIAPVSSMMGSAEIASSIRDAAVDGPRYRHAFEVTPASVDASTYYSARPSGSSSSPSTDHRDDTHSPRGVGGHARRDDCP